MNNNKQFLALWGLKWNPFSVELPTEALVSTKKVEQFRWRTENMVLDGGFGLITGESGLGKSVALRQVAERLSGVRDITVAEFSRPQSGVSDFYREIGALFGVELRVNNRFGGFKALREKWRRTYRRHALPTGIACGRSAGDAALCPFRVAAAQQLSVRFAGAPYHDPRR